MSLHRLDLNPTAWRSASPIRSTRTRRFPLWLPLIGLAVLCAGVVL